MSFVKLNKVGLDFPLPGGRFKTAIQDVSLKARPGDRIGLIGQNGAGKTTLLRLINGVYHPSRGRLYRSGRVGSMINASVGMDIKSSAEDNLAWRARQKGMNPEMIKEIISRTIDFTELGPRFSDPLRTYSAGMMARVAFSIATAFEADIYLLDEWLSAGDSRFKDRSQSRMEELLTPEKIMFFASHSDGMIRDWCNKVLLMHEGAPVAFTNVFDGFAMMRELMRGADIEQVRSKAAAPDAGWSATPLELGRVEREAFSASTGGSASAAKPVEVDIHFDLKRAAVATIDGDFGLITSRETLPIKPDKLYRASAEFEQIKDGVNGRSSGAFVGFIALNERFERLSNAYHINRFATDLKSRHGKVRGAFEFIAKDLPDARYLRFYAGANYSGSAPHSNGLASISSMRVTQCDRK